MKIEDARALCYKCSCFRLITYPDGDTGIGCYAAGIDYPPVNVLTLERCPKGRGASDNVNKMDLLKILGKIFAETCVAPAKISLTKMFKDAHPSNRGRDKWPKVLIKEKVVKVVRTSGVHHWYKWNTSAPSLDMVDALCFKLQESREVEAKFQPLQLFQIRNGMTDCSTCRCRKLPECQDIMLKLGLDCKRFDLNTMEIYNETGVGQQAEV